MIKLRLHAVFLIALMMNISWFQVVWADLSDGVVAYYPFNNNANDESGNGNHGTVQGATLAEDRFGNTNSAYYFGGDNDKITASDAAVFQFGTQAFTISVWVKTTQTGIWKRIVTRRAPTGSSGFWYSLAMVNNKARFEIAAKVQMDSISDINDGEWHLVTVTRNLSTHLFSMYIDGQLESTLIDSGSDLSLVNNVPLEIGVWNTEAYEGTTFNGFIDDICIHNHTLSEDEIQSFYTGEKGCKSDLLVELIDFKATPIRNSIRLDWETASETDTAGFYIWRGIPLTGKGCTGDISNYSNVVQLSFDGAKGYLLSSRGAIYSRVDSNVVPKTTYCYLLEDIEFDGGSKFYWEFIDSATVD